jgi:hypothetical protein
MAIDILGKARRLEASLSQSFDEAARRLANPGARQPLEVMTAVVDAVASRVEPAGRGAYVFPFNKINVMIAAPGREARTRFEAVLQARPSLQQRIADRLHVAGCEVSALIVDLALVAQAEPHWLNDDFHLEFERVAAVSEPAVEESPTADHVRVTVISGSTQKPTYAFALHRINLGRCAEVRDGRHRLIRTNHVAFIDGSELNHSVSRRHAHIERDTKPGQYRVCDDGSAHGTSIVRNGRTIAVPTGARGVRLQSGDEIALGDARLRIRF